METAAPEVSRDLARLMLMMRRLVKEEFTVTIHLSDPEASCELLAFADRSRNTLLRQMGCELKSSLAPNADEEPAAVWGKTAHGATVYRGAVVHASNEGHPNTAASAVRPTRIYRGRLVG